MTGLPVPKIRVAVVGPTLSYLGGQAVQVRRLLDRLDSSAEVEATFVPTNPALPGPLAALQRIKYLRTLVTSVAFVLSLLRQLRRTDVVHVFSPSYWAFLLGPVPAMLIGRLYGCGVLLNYHSGEAEDHLRRSGRIVIPLMRIAHEIVVPSEFLVEVFGRFGLPATAIYNFLDAEAYPHREREALAPQFLSNRNFEAHYNVAGVLRAFAVVQRSRPDAVLTVAGDGRERAALEALAGSLALRGVTFTGAVAPERMPALYGAADLYLNASLIDNMPLSILEAFAAGLPVVTSDAGGIPYIVRDGETGLLAPAGDADALAAAALRLLENPALAHRLSTGARAECLRRYTWSPVGAGWHACYRRLYAVRRRPLSAPAGAQP